MLLLLLSSCEKCFPPQPPTPPISPFLYIYIDDNNFNVADIVCLRCALTGQIDRQPNWQTIYQAHTHTQQRSRMCKENKLDYPQPRFFGIAALVLLAFAIIFFYWFVLCQFVHTLCLMAFIVAWQYAYRQECVLFAHTFLIWLLAVPCRISTNGVWGIFFAAPTKIYYT